MKLRPMDQDQENYADGLTNSRGQQKSRSANKRESQERPMKNQEEELHDSLAYSSALVGEVIVDSPQQCRPINPRSYDTDMSLSYPDFPKMSRRPATPPPLSTDNANGLTVGLMAQGLAWVQKQRETRKRLYLKNQAAQQLSKLRQAREATMPRSLLDNPTFQNFLFKSEYKNTESEADPHDFDSAATVSKSGDGISVALGEYDNDAEELNASFIPPVRTMDEHDDTDYNPFLLTRPQMQFIAANVLPRGIAYCRWKRLYSLARDGDAFDACMRCISGHPRTLIVVRTAREAVFGAFADGPWDPHVHGGACYFGGSNACLFKVVNGKVKYYKWTGANHYIQLCDVNHKMIAFGGGGDDGAFGLCLQEDFQIGSTGHCATFDNEPLCDQENFDIVDMEVYGFLVGQF